MSGGCSLRMVNDEHPIWTAKRHGRNSDPILSISRYQRLTYKQTDGVKPGFHFFFFVDNELFLITNNRCEPDTVRRRVET